MINIRKIVALPVVMCVLTGMMPVGIINAENKEVTKTYIISSNEIEEIVDKYEAVDTVNDNGQELVEENDLAAVRLTETELQNINKDKSVNYVEEDAVVSASTDYKKPHKKQVKVNPRNNKETEWNMQMIHADKKVKKSKNRIKVAVLDSGVDFGNDIDLAGTITLVPGEEDMNPLFMDGTGHGNSVAGLIAAKDNNEGITGVNPNAEIYSIRVLDDNNQAPISRIIEGIYMAIAENVNIINMSFGTNQYSKALHQAVKDANDAGILVIAAAGNTGEQGVQYPAAFNEVMAVGSVDKSGEVSDTSAIGDEIEIVAPGELVRSTGEFGNELVASGTSLAAPQVAGAASLLWEKDSRATAAIIRYYLNSCANLYGEKTEYGNGLLDLQYTTKCFEKRSKGFIFGSVKSGGDYFANEIDNKREIITFKDTGCVAGSWSRDNHEKLIPAKYTNVKKGARFPDTDAACYYDGSEINGKKLYIFAGMSHNPWWHGYYQKSKVVKKDSKYVYKGEYYNNYVASYIYITRLANQLKTGKTAIVPGGISDTVKNLIKNDVGKIDWKRQYGNIPSKGTKRAFVWGMALHTLADSFAHSTCDMNGNVIKHPDSDYTTTISQRWNHAGKAVISAVKKYELGESASGKFSDFEIVKQATNYKMITIQKYMKEVAGEKTVNAYSKVSKSIA